MNKVILFRKSLDEEGEFDTARSIWGESLIEFRSQVPENCIVICRYAALPFYEELEKELALKGSYMINSYKAHSYIANMEWAFEDLKTLTPETWAEWHNLPEGCSFVLKGKTNSMKFKWNTHMFAKNKEEVPLIASNLIDDSLIGNQGIMVRKYYPLKKLDEAINGLPISNEWRFFVLDGNIISSGFYWSILEKREHFSAPDDAISLVKRAIEKIPSWVRFVVIDVAETEDGDWIVIELNDGQMSGLSFNDPKKLYSNLKFLDINHVI